MKIRTMSALRAAAMSACILTTSSVFGAEADQAQIDAVKAAVKKYEDVYAAVRDGYFSTVGCVHYDGVKKPGHVEYQKGAMGIHFVNVGAMGPEVDPMKPPVLVYEPVGDQLKLVAVEYFVPLATGIKERPKLFGQEFQGPMEGHEPLIPHDFHHYDLHMWLVDNPYGMFEPTNPNVNCEGYAFSLPEEPTKLVPPN